MYQIALARNVKHWRDSCRRSTSWPDRLGTDTQRTRALINEVLSASKQKLSAKEAKKLVTKVDKMLKKFGANSHLLGAKVYLETCWILRAVVFVFHPNSHPGPGCAVGCAGSAPSGSPTDEAYLAAIAGAPC